MVELRNRYGWEAEHLGLNGEEVVRQYNGKGDKETPSTKIRAGEVVRFSIVPRVSGLPRHDILIDRNLGEKFVRRFGRGFMKDKGKGIRHFEYLQCVVTNKYRLWVFSTTGRILVTNPDFEVYL